MRSLSGYFSLSVWKEMPVKGVTELLTSTLARAGVSKREVNSKLSNCRGPLGPEEQKRKRCCQNLVCGPLRPLRNPLLPMLHRGPRGQHLKRPLLLLLLEPHGPRTHSPQGSATARGTWQKPGGNVCPSLFPIPNHLPASPINRT